MAAPVARDLVKVRKDLARWLATRVPDFNGIEITRLTSPEYGTSSETLFLDAEIMTSGGRREVHWVVRIQATSIQVYEDPRVERQFRIMDVLARSTNIPVPRVLWLESTQTPFGAPFFIMERMEGQVASNYNSPGWLADLKPDARERLWVDAMQTLARLHATDLALVKFLDRPELGPTGLDQEIATWDRYLDWSRIPKHLTLVRAQQWLHDHAPANKPTGLAWGDAQLGNIIFHSGKCAAVIDWETVSLGGAEEDLCWWLIFDEYYSTMSGLVRLPGLGDRDATIGAWEQFAGRKLAAMEWHEVFANWRVAMIADRAVALYAANGISIPGMAPGDGNPYIVRLARLLSERH